MDLRKVKGITSNKGMDEAKYFGKVKPE